MGSEREESRWEASQHLEDGCQFGFVLPFDLFFFSLLMLILCNVFSSMMSGREHWTRRPGWDPKCVPGVLHKDLSSTVQRAFS